MRTLTRTHAEISTTLPQNACGGTRQGILPEEQGGTVGPRGSAWVRVSVRVSAGSGPAWVRVGLRIRVSVRVSAGSGPAWVRVSVRVSAGSGPAWVRMGLSQCPREFGIWARVGPRGSASVSALVWAMGPHGSARVRAGTRVRARIWACLGSACSRQCMWDLDSVGLKIVCFFGKVAGERL